MSVKMVKHKLPGACVSQKTTKSWQELSESTIGTLKEVQGLQQLGERPQIQDEKILWHSLSLALPISPAQELYGCGNVVPEWAKQILFLGLLFSSFDLSVGFLSTDARRLSLFHLTWNSLGGEAATWRMFLCKTESQKNEFLSAGPKKNNWDKG